MSSQGNLEMNYQAKEYNQEYNQNQFLPQPQPNQFVNSQPYIDPNFMNQNQNGIFIGQNNNMQIPLNNGAYPNNNIQVQSLPNKNNNEVNNECNRCCKKSLIILCSLFILCIIIIVIIICAGGIDFSFHNTDCKEEPDHPDC